MTSAGWQSVELNGEPIGEITLDSLLFGLVGVPVLLLSGDDKTCEEARRLLPWAKTNATKSGTGRHSALLKAPKRVYEEIPGAVKSVLASRARAKPLKTPAPPYELKIRFLNTDQADALSYDGVRRIRLDGWTALYRDEDLVRLLESAM
jgi:D-amino peptidase